MYNTRNSMTLLNCRQMQFICLSVVVYVVFVVFYSHIDTHTTKTILFIIENDNRIVVKSCVWNQNKE